jgi:hypothetical protein
MCYESRFKIDDIHEFIRSVPLATFEEKRLTANADDQKLYGPGGESAAGSGMGKREKAVRVFFDWVNMGLRLPDVELAFESFPDVEIPPTMKFQTTDAIDAIDNLMKALINFRSINKKYIEIELKRRKIVALDKWKENRTA